jgi:hypothetical protein
LNKSLKPSQVKKVVKEDQELILQGFMINNTITFSTKCTKLLMLRLLEKKMNPWIQWVTRVSHNGIDKKDNMMQ